MSLDSALTGLSSNCQQALPRLLTSSFASCAQVLNLVSIATSSSDSIVQPITNYIDGLCTTTPCSQSDLSNASSIVTQGCSSDIQSGSIIPTALNELIDNFGGVRSLLCTKHTSNNTYCVPEILGAAQNATGTDITLSSLSSLASGSNTTTFLDSIPKSVYCTDCGDAIVDEALKIAQNISADSVDTIKQQAQSACGSSFADGTLPQGISTAGSTGVGSSSSSSGGSGAAGRGMQISGKTLTIVGTLSAAILGASMVIA